MVPLLICMALCIVGQRLLCFSYYSEQKLTAYQVKGSNITGVFVMSTKNTRRSCLKVKPVNLCKAIIFFLANHKKRIFIVGEGSYTSPP